MLHAIVRTEKVFQGKMKDRTREGKMKDRTREDRLSRLAWHY